MQSCFCHSLACQSLLTVRNSIVLFPEFPGCELRWREVQWMVGIPKRCYFRWPWTFVPRCWLVAWIRRSEVVPAELSAELTDRTYPWNLFVEAVRSARRKPVLCTLEMVFCGRFPSQSTNYNLPRPQCSVFWP